MLINSMSEHNYYRQLVRVLSTPIFDTDSINVNDLLPHMIG